MPAKQEPKPKNEKVVAPIVAPVLPSAPSAPPDPHLLLVEAMEEPNFFDLRPYIGVIGTLRKKGFSYREITTWLNDRGLDTNYSAVYRTFQSSLTPAEAQHEEARTTDEEQGEQMRGY